MSHIRHNDNSLFLIYNCLVQSYEPTLLKCLLDQSKTTGTNDTLVTYTLQSIKKDEGHKLSFNSVTIDITKQNSFLAEQNSPQEIYSKGEITINLPDDINYCPNFYFEMNENSKLENCIIIEDYTIVHVFSQKRLIEDNIIFIIKMDVILKILD